MLVGRFHTSPNYYVIFVLEASEFYRTLDQRLGMGCPELVDHYRTDLRAGFDQSLKNFGAAFLPMRVDAGDSDKIPPGPPPAPNDRSGCAGRKLKEPAREGVMKL